MKFYAFRSSKKGLSRTIFGETFGIWIPQLHVKLISIHVEFSQIVIKITSQNFIWKFEELVTCGCVPLVRAVVGGCSSGSMELLDFWERYNETTRFLRFGAIEPVNFLVCQCWKHLIQLIAPALLFGGHLDVRTLFSSHSKIRNFNWRCDFYYFSRKYHLC